MSGRRVNMAIIAAWVTMLALAIVGILLTGCKTVHDTTAVTIRDSVIVHYVTDTVHEVIHDTAGIQVTQSVKTNEGTEIEFSDGGGTYNAKTGEATNVSSVKQHNNSAEDTHIVAEYKHKAEILQKRADSLQMIVKSYQIASEQKHNTADEKPKPLRWPWIIALLALSGGVIWWLNRKYNIFAKIMRIFGV